MNHIIGPRGPLRCLGNREDDQAARWSWRRLLPAVAGLVSAGMAAADCPRPAAPTGELLEYLPRMYVLKGPAGDFDPCDSSVEFLSPRASGKSPLVIISHGGAGLGEAERNIALAFRQLGFATLLYDAYRMSGFNRDWRFWAEQVSNESRQRMNYKATWGAYEWALKEPRVDSSRIYLHGLSNGANVVVNMAGAVDPAHVKGVFAEGTMMSGIGVPDKLRVPVRLIFGKLDNYGGRQQDEWRWLLREACALNGRSYKFMQPEGSAQRCNLDMNPTASTQTPLEWFEDQKRAGADIDLWWYENAAHGMFLGPLTYQTRTWGASDLRYAWIGGSSDARNKFLADFQTYAEGR